MWFGSNNDSKMSVIIILNNSQGIFDNVKGWVDLGRCLLYIYIYIYKGKTFCLKSQQKCSK